MSRIPINLASDPFRRDRAMLVASVAVAIVLTITLLISVVAIFSGRGQAQATRVVVDRLDTQLKAVGAQQAKLDITLHKPENAEVLERSLFLNSLIERKSVSWTRIFNDLEKVMPYNVRLVSVRLPQIDSQNQVLLDMMVGADDFAPVLSLLKKLEASPQFGPTTVVTSTPPSQTDKLWKYRVSVNYAQKL